MKSKGLRIIGILLFGLITIVIIKKYFLSEPDNNYRCIVQFNFFELIEYGVCNPETKFIDTISIRLNDSVKLYKENVLRLKENYDSINKELSIEFIKDLPFGCEDVKIKERNIFRILINKHDSILINGERFISIDSLKTDLIDYITNPLEDYDIPEKRLDSIEFIGEILITKYYVFIKAAMIPDSNNIHTTWGNLFHIANAYLLTVDKLRDDFSNVKWNMNFDDLSLNEKLSVIQVYPKKLEIGFNYHPIPKPLPLTDEMNEIIENSITIDKEELEIKIDN